MALPDWLTRRRLLAAAGTLAAGAAGVGLYTWRVEPWWLEFARHPLPVRDLPDGLLGRALVQVSDLHAGQVDRDYLTDALRRVAALRPDVVVFTGDFMSCRGTEWVDEAAAVVEALPPAPLGTFAVMGNHDYGAHWRRGEVADALTRRLTDLGVRVLRNEVVDLAGLQLVGLDDYWGPFWDRGQALSTVDPRRPAVALCHNPDGCDEPVWGNFRGWVLSGHTHGGQCKPPFLPPPVLPVKNKRYTAGEFELTGGRSLYINRGVGFVKQVRINARPEVTVHRLERA